MAYAFILTHEGYPCVFWQDYYTWGLGRPRGEHHGIAALVKVHEDHAGGATSVLHVDDDLYIMQRSGIDAQSGLVFVMNNRGRAWNGHWGSRPSGRTRPSFLFRPGAAAMMPAIRRNSRPGRTARASFPRRREGTRSMPWIKMIALRFGSLLTPYQRT